VNQYALADPATYTNANGTGDTIIKINTDAKKRTPDTGTVAVYDGATGLYDFIPYTAVNRTATNGAEFTVAALSKNYSNLANCWVPFIYSEASSSSITVQVEYNSTSDGSDAPLVARVRKKGILPFEGTATLSGATTINAVRTQDTIVD
jgi:hypothetical protein